MRKQFEQWKRGQGRNTQPNPEMTNPQQNPSPQTPRSLWSKALLVTVPLALLLQFVPPNGTSMQIPGVVRFV